MLLYRDRFEIAVGPFFLNNGIAPGAKTKNLLKPTGEGDESKDMDHVKKGAAKRLKKSSAFFILRNSKCRLYKKDL